MVAFARGTSLQDLAYCGMVGICDPPRPFVREAIQTLIQGGVKVKLVTGDAQETAVAIGKYLFNQKLVYRSSKLKFLLID